MPACDVMSVKVTADAALGSTADHDENRRSAAMRRQVTIE
jgi:hypothetical protein